ncbi:HEAT repeat domain-containing protein [Aquimarina sp. AD10]|uniref:HEAT repeat domain-containing protein n=1 Tax=Aquimarina sp. AD10 TaxID=1714849 RepID=UPI000E4C9F72|nr:HEAT repeat domain-containing protein [Aquimarina sp. AD10]AXT61813.1 HEAT repeat domain-containing protein [Aquimarina sp. AD10]RKN02611.1 HEAT repeat domain-containing protein [Aquimarina sp. AD10]
MINDENIIKERLLAVGISINSIYDLVNTKEKYPKAIPILIELLNKKLSFNSNIIEGIVRALAVKEAKGIANKVLFELYEATADDEFILNWAIGNTIHVIVEPKDKDDLIKIISDKTKGNARQMFVLALGKIKGKKSEEVLIQSLKEKGLTLHALKALGKLKCQAAVNEINSLLNSDNKVVAKEAEKILKKIKL